ncbi:MAG TPA: tetratricopeptide repeat protein [Gemmatimonadaceae bacterium]|nr:tetratricopeptide repeat protein [Gemmatimonadaceae bacterium]
MARPPARRLAPAPGGGACSAERNAERPSEGGVAACRAAIQRDSADADAYDGLAAGLAGLGRYEEALAAWRVFARLKPDDFGGHHNAGLMLEFLQRFAESLPTFERALPLAESVRDQQTAAWHIGVAHSHLGRPGEALRWFREAAALDSTDASAWSYAGVMAVRMGRPGEAVSYWRRALGADPDYFDKVQAGERTMFQRALAAAGDQPPARVERLGLVPALRGK